MSPSSPPQVLHDAFFKYQTKPKLSGPGDMYYEGKEFEAAITHAQPGAVGRGRAGRGAGMVTSRRCKGKVFWHWLTGHSPCLFVDHTRPLLPYILQAC